jgi:UDP-3-O-[3-hydroxymyristoyl] glucosamine N-acyltransferase
LAELAKLTSAKLLGNETHSVSGVSSLEEATCEDISFLTNSRYKEAMAKSLAGIICISPSGPFIEGKNYLISDNPSITFQQIAELFIGNNEKTAFDSIHSTAVIHPTAKIGKNVAIGPYSVVDKNAVINDNSIIYAQVYIGAGTHIGKNCLIYPSVVIRERCCLGDRVIIQPGAIIGSCGFGFTINSEGKMQKLEQIGSVIIEDDVEIGANTTIDRARFKSTIIRRGTKVDNLVQIAHNVEIGENNGIAAQTGIAGSAKTGNNVLMGGQVGIVGHVKVTDNVMIATRGGVSKSLLTAGKYRGSPAIPLTEHNKEQVHIRKLAQYVETIRILQKKVEELEKS